MATTPDTLPALIAPNMANMPAQLLDAARWAPWRAVWNPKGNGGAGKYEKIPHRWNRPEHGLSNKTAAGWGRFDQAWAAYQQHQDKFAGVGYLMTGPHGVVAVDLDHCVVDGVVAPWAAEVIAKLDSYTELSPSGNGLRVMVAGEVERDWTNHERGIEIYGGGDARFVTITGAKLPGAPSAIRAPRAGVMDSLAARWRSVLTSAQIHDLHLPVLLGADEMPDVADLDLPTYARNFLLEGPEPGDRSRQLFAASIALRQTGLAPDVILSILEANEHAMEVALDHRRQDYDKALRYLWKDHCQAGAARADGLRQLQLDEFDDLVPAQVETDPIDDLADLIGTPEVAAPVLSISIMDDFDDLGADEQQATPVPAGTPKTKRFALLSPQDFMARKPATWIVRDVLPRAGMGVIFGASGSGKTFFTLDLAMCIVRGEPWRGKHVTKGRGVYIVAEGASGFRTRLEAYCEHHGVDPASLDIRFMTDAPNLLDKADIRELMVSLLSFGKLDFIVIDTYARAMAGANENDAKDVGQAVAHCDIIHRKTGATVLLVHHSGKDASGGARGSSALRAAADVEIEVVRTQQYRAATITKMKDGQDGQEYQFKLADVEVGRDDEGEAITSCVVEHRENSARRPMGGKTLTPRQTMVLQVLDECMSLDGTGVHYSELKRIAVAQIPLDPDKKVDNRGRDVSRDIEHLVAAGILQQDGQGVFSLVESAN